MRSLLLAISLIASSLASAIAAQNPTATIRVQVRASEKPVEGASVEVVAGTVRGVVVELQPQPTLEETVTVVASTRTDKRLEDQPMRVEVLAREEIEEKMLMTPGDMLNWAVLLPRVASTSCNTRRSRVVAQYGDDGRASRDPLHESVSGILSN